MSDTQAQRGYLRVTKAIEFIERRAHEQPSLQELADHLGLSESHTQRLFRCWAGVSPKQFMQNLTLARAQRLLVDNHSVMDTSLAVGLSGPGRLHDHFVSIEAVTPGEFQTGGAGLMIDWGYADTLFGRVCIATSMRGICFLEFSDSKNLKIDHHFSKNWPNAVFRRDDKIARRWAAKIFTESGPKGRFHVWIKGTHFQLQVWRALLAIPLGSVTHYQGLADRVKRPTAARAVAAAVAANPVGFLIPCHRVLRKSGHLGGYRWDPVRKKVILAWEAARCGYTNVGSSAESVQ